MRSLVSLGYSLLLLCLSTILFSSCQDNLTENVPAQFQVEDPVVLLSDQATAVQFEDIMANLVAQNGFALWSTSDRFLHMRDFAEEQQIPFDLERAIGSYEAGVANADRLQGSAFMSEEYEHIFALVTGLGYGPELAEELTSYREELSNRVSQQNISQADFNQLEGTAQQLEQLALSPSFQLYAAKMEALGSNGRSTTEKCIRLVTTIAGLTAACATGNIFACIGLAWAIADLVRRCPDSPDPTDPCANSPNPCCGAPTCASGYVQNVNCDCVLDPNGTGCLVTGCPPGFDCANNVCIPQ